MPADTEDMDSVCSPSSPVASELSGDQLAQLQRAGHAHRMIRRTAGVALFSGVSTLLIGLASAVCAAVWPDVIGVVGSALLVLIGGVELLGRRRLLRGDPASARLLMRNQLALLALAVAYCIFQMASFSVDRLKNDALPPEVRSQLGAMPDIAHTIDQNVERWGTLAHYGTYCVLMIASLGFQGGLAFYYATRRKHLDAFGASAPPWARQLVQKLAA